jgi:hypothetical protein
MDTDLVVRAQRDDKGPTPSSPPRSPIGSLPFRAGSCAIWTLPRTRRSRRCSRSGRTSRNSATRPIWIIDVEGTLVWIDGETYKGAGPEPGQQIQQIIDSIRFE